ncbi:type I-E CRISPR-associated protein Cas5/CasD [Deinococcota bacterium DY0809b]
MATLLLKFIAPMQSWGSRSRFDIRDTEREPTKSGVLGLVAAALGRDRTEPIDDLSALRLGVRVDREGAVRYDFQTAKDVIRASVTKEQWLRARTKGKTTGTQDTVVSRRYFLSDAAFLVGLEGDDVLLSEIETALKRPKWTLFLGRKGYLPGEPVHFPESGLRKSSLEATLAWERPIVDKSPRPTRRFVIELVTGCTPGFPWLVHEVWDQPVAPFSERRFGVRRVGEITLEPGEVPKPCT